MSAWLENIQLQVSRRMPQSHALMSPAMSANAGVGQARASAHKSAVALNARAKARSEIASLTIEGMGASYPATLNAPPS